MFDVDPPCWSTWRGSARWNLHGGYESRICGGFWANSSRQPVRPPPPPHPANTHIRRLFPAMQTAAVAVSSPVAAGRRGGTLERTGRRWRRRTLMTSRIPGRDKSRWGGNVACPASTYAKRLHIFAEGVPRWEFIKLTHGAHSHPTVQEHFSWLSLHWRM